MKFNTMSSFFVILSGAAGIVCGAFFLEDRYVCSEEVDTLIQKNSVILNTKIKENEFNSVKTFLLLQQQMKLETMEDLKDKQVLISKELKRSPEDTYLNLRKEEINRKIQRLEGSIY